MQLALRARRPKHPLLPSPIAILAKKGDAIGPHRVFRGHRGNAIRALDALPTPRVHVESLGENSFGLLLY